MVSLVFLAVGVVCILIGRILLIGAAFGVSVWWGLGIFLPFGPMLFRISYPDLAPWSRTFRLIALPCILAYFVIRPGAPDYDKFFKQKPVPSAPANHYALEKVSKVMASSVEKRREANEKEFARLAAWNWVRARHAVGTISSPATARTTYLLRRSTCSRCVQSGVVPGTRRTASGGSA